MFSTRCIESTIRIMASTIFLLALTPLSADDKHGHANQLPNMFSSTNAHGKDATYSTAGFIDLNNPFLKTWGATDVAVLHATFLRKGGLSHHGVFKRFLIKRPDSIRFFVWSMALIPQRRMFQRLRKDAKPIACCLTREIFG